MYENSKELIKILKAFLFEEKYSQANNTQMEDIIKIASLHNVTAMVGYVLEKNNVSLPDNIKSKIFNKKLQCGILGAKREVIFNEISDALSENHIEHIIVKGYVLRELYPIKDLRTMSDLDFVIKPKDGKKMENIMSSLGFSFDKFFKGEWLYSKNGLAVEFHERLTESELGNGFDYKTYLEDCFNHTVEFKSMTKTLNNEYHLIYMLIHCAKHFYNEGCGVRMIMDFAAYFKHYNDTLNWNYINDELKNIMLYEFSQSIWYLCQEWFSIKPQGKIYTMDTQVYNMLFPYIMEGGVYGTDDLSRLGNKIARIDIENSNKSGFALIIAKLKESIFLDDKTMKSQISWYKNMPSFLLPFAWASKAFNSVRYKGLGHTKKIITSNRENEAVANEYNMLKGIGLYNKK